jgi:hypothetical protein
VASPRLNARGRPYGVGVAEAERQYLLELLSELRKVDAWVARMDPSTRPPGPPPGSSLYGDDARTRPYELSHGAWHALSHAVDHLNCLHVLLKDAQVIHMFAPFSLVRAALENASAAVWMLQPPSRTSRVCRRFRFAVANIRNGDAAKQLAGLEGGRRRDVLIDEVRELARRPGSRQPRLRRRWAIRRSSPALPARWAKTPLSSRSPGACAAAYPTVISGRP